MATDKTWTILTPEPSKNQVACIITLVGFWTRSPTGINRSSASRSGFSTCVVPCGQAQRPSSAERGWAKLVISWINKLAKFVKDGTKESTSALLHASTPSGVRSEVNSELNFPPKLRGARSRLYRRRFLQVSSKYYVVSTRWKAIDEIYKIYCWITFFCTAQSQNVY